MANYARVINNTAVDVSTDPTNQFHPDIAAQFVQVPDEVQQGWILKDGQWSEPAPAPQPEPEPVYPKVTPVQFKLLFTSPERVAIKGARADDPVVDDLWELVEDPRMEYVDFGLKSVRDSIEYLATAGLIAPERVAEILAGKLV
jgi:hypothetical protein